MFKESKKLVLIYMSALVMFTFKFVVFSKLTNLPLVVNNIISIIGIFMIFAFLISFMGLKAQIISLEIFNSILGVILFVDAFYYSYFKDFTSIFTIKNLQYAGDVLSSLETLYSWTLVLLVIDIPLYFIINKFINKETNKVNINLAYTNITIPLAVTGLLGILLNLYAIYDTKKLDPYVFESLYNKKFVVQKTNILLYHYFDLKKYIKNNSNNFVIAKEHIEEAREYLKNNTIKKDELYGRYKDKNLIIIQLESFQNFVIGKSINGVEITPNLNKLLNESVYMPNFYYQTLVGGTSDAEFLTNVGLYPLPDTPVYYAYMNKVEDSIPQLLKLRGYNTIVMHGNEGGFWNRTAVYKRLNYDEFMDISKYNNDETIMMGLSDKSFFEQNYIKLKKLKKPFYSFIITLSTHHPFNDKQFKNEMDAGEFEGTLMGNYIKSMHYLDRQVGMFLDNLKKDGILDDSVVILYGDHHGIPYQDKMELEKFLGIKIEDEFDWYKNQTTFGLIRLPNGEYSKIYEGKVGQVDIYPTILHLFGLESKGFLGKSIFQKNDNEVIIPSGILMHGDKMFISNLNKGKNIEDGNMLEKKETELNIKRLNDILRYNYTLLREGK